MPSAPELNHQRCITVPAPLYVAVDVGAAEHTESARDQVLSC
jgi:hypothetical protein